MAGGDRRAARLSRAETIERSGGPSHEVTTTPDRSVSTVREDDRLLDLLEEWEDRYRRDEDAAPDSFGVNDPALMEVLRERIERQKRLYEFMKLSPSEQGRRDAPAAGRCPIRSGRRSPARRTRRRSAGTG